MSELAKHCISCHEDGHTYIDCSNVSFGGLVGGWFESPDITGSQQRAINYLDGRSLSDIRADCEQCP